MKKFNNLMTYESYNMVNEGIKVPELSQQMKADIDAFVAKNKAWLQKVLINFKGKSAQEITTMLATPSAPTSPVTEGVITDKLKEVGNKIKSNIGNWLTSLSTGVSVASFGTMLFGLFQLAQSGAVTNFLSGGALALLASVVIYAVGKVFGGQN